MKTSDYVMVNTTHDDVKKAEELAEYVLQRRLAACVHMRPVKSMYWWKGQLERSEEVLLSFKTTRECSGVLQAAVRERHSYETPEIIELPITDGLPEYLGWIDEECCVPGGEQGDVNE